MSRLAGSMPLPPGWLCAVNLPLCALQFAAQLTSQVLNVRRSLRHSVVLNKNVQTPFPVLFRVCQALESIISKTILLLLSWRTQYKFNSLPLWAKRNSITEDIIKHLNDAALIYFQHDEAIQAYQNPVYAHYKFGSASAQNY